MLSIKKFLLLFALLSIGHNGTILPMNSAQPSEKHAIVYLISNPRASLVEFLRMIGTRGDIKVMHIPANYAYCHANNYVETVKGWYRDDAPTTYSQAKEDIIEEAKKSDVIVGENTHTVNEFLKANPDFISNPDVQFMVLISEPHGSIISYYEQKKDYFDKLPETQMSASIGFEGLYNLLQELKNSDKGLPLIISTESLYYNTRETVQKVCDYLNIPFKEESLQWKDISENFTTFESEGWYTIELTECSKKWHGKAIRSTGFTEPGKYAVDTEGNPTFEEIENPKHKEICKRAYLDNLAFYKKIQDLIKE